MLDNSVVLEVEDNTSDPPSPFSTPPETPKNGIVDKEPVKNKEID